MRQDSKEDDFCEEKEDDWGKSMEEDDLYNSLTPYLGDPTPTLPSPRPEGSLERSRNPSKEKEAPRMVPGDHTAIPVEGHGGGTTLKGATVQPESVPPFCEVVDDRPFGGDDATAPTTLEACRRLGGDGILRRYKMDEQTDMMMNGRMNRLNSETPAPPVDSHTKQQAMGLSQNTLSEPEDTDIEKERDDMPDIGIDDPPPNLMSPRTIKHSYTSLVYRRRTISPPPLCRGSKVY